MGTPLQRRLRQRGRPCPSLSTSLPLSLPQSRQEFVCHWSLGATLQLFGQNQPLPTPASSGKEPTHTALRSRKFQPLCHHCPAWPCDSLSEPEGRREVTAEALPAGLCLGPACSHDLPTTQQLGLRAVEGAKNRGKGCFRLLSLRPLLSTSPDNPQARVSLGHKPRGGLLGPGPQTCQPYRRAHVFFQSG